MRLRDIRDMRDIRGLRSATVLARPHLAVASKNKLLLRRYNLEICRSLKNGFLAKR